MCASLSLSYGVDYLILFCHFMLHALCRKTGKRELTLRNASPVKVKWANTKLHQRKTYNQTHLKADHPVIQPDLNKVSVPLCSRWQQGFFGNRSILLRWGQLVEVCAGEQVRGRVHVALHYVQLCVEAYDRPEPQWHMADRPSAVDDNFSHGRRWKTILWIVMTRSVLAWKHESTAEESVFFFFSLFDICILPCW